LLLAPPLKTCQNIWCEKTRVVIKIDSAFSCYDVEPKYDGQTD